MTGVVKDVKFHHGDGGSRSFLQFEGPHRDPSRSWPTFKLATHKFSSSTKTIRVIGAKKSGRGQEKRVAGRHIRLGRVSGDTPSTRHGGGSATSSGGEGKGRKGKRAKAVARRAKGNGSKGKGKGSK